jgi:hypothetical protein
VHTHASAVEPVDADLDVARRGRLGADPQLTRDHGDLPREPAPPTTRAAPPTAFRRWALVCCGRPTGHGLWAPEVFDDLALFLTGGSAAIIDTWVIEGPDPLAPEAFTDRLLRMPPVVTRRPSDRESQP